MTSALAWIIAGLIVGLAALCSEWFVKAWRVGRLIRAHFRLLDTLYFKPHTAAELLAYELEARRLGNPFIALYFWWRRVVRHE